MGCSRGHKTLVSAIVMSSYLCPTWSATKSNVARRTTRSNQEARIAFARAATRRHSYSLIAEATLHPSQMPSIS